MNLPVYFRAEAQDDVFAARSWPVRSEWQDFLASARPLPAKRGTRKKIGRKCT